MNDDFVAEQNRMWSSRYEGVGQNFLFGPELNHFLAERGLAVLNFIKKHPGWMIGGVLLSVYRSNPLGKYLRQGLVTWLAICKLL